MATKNYHRKRNLIHDFPIKYEKLSKKDHGKNLYLREKITMNLKFRPDFSNNFIKSCKAYNYLKLNAVTIQAIVSFIICFLFMGNFYSIYVSCDEYNSIYRVCEPEKSSIDCKIKVCNVLLSLLYIFLINLITSLMIYYDHLQFIKKSNGLNEYFKLFLMWSGGWIVAWLLIVYFGEKRNLYITKRNGILATIFSLTSLLFFFIINSYLN